MNIRKPRCRSGCSTCRIRKIKCDEAKPCCTKCASTGRKCDWASSTSTAVTTQQTFEKPMAPINVLGPSLPRLESLSELRALEFFRTRTSLALGSGFDSEYWNTTALRIASFDSMTRNAIVALSSMHEEFELSPRPLSQRGQFTPAKRHALLHYILATNQMQHQLSTLNAQSATLLLAAAVGLICVELLQDNYRAAICHFEGALQIISTYYSQNSISVLPDDNTLAASVIRLFYQLVVQTLYVQKIGIHDSILPKLPAIDIPSIFSSIREAKDFLDLCSISSYPCLRKLRDSSTLSDSAYHIYVKETTALSYWRHSFAKFLPTLGAKMGAKEMVGIELLNIQYLCLREMLDTAYHSVRAVQHTTVSSFPHILDLIQGLLEPSGECLLPRYSFDSGIIGPLFFAAVHAPSIQLRRRAVDLLRHPNIPYREGIFSSTMTLAIVQRITTLQMEVLLCIAASSTSLEKHDYFTGGEDQLPTAQVLPATLFDMCDLVDEMKRMKISVWPADLGSMHYVKKEGVVTWNSWV